MTKGIQKDSLRMIRHARMSIQAILWIILACVLYMNHEWLSTLVKTLFKKLTINKMKLILM